MSNAITEFTLTPAQAESVRDAGVFTMGTIRWLNSQLIENLTPKQWIHQPTAGVNHILWNIGHIAISEQQITNAVGGAISAAPDRYEKLFGMGSEPQADLGAYPDPQEVVTVFNEVRTAAIDHLRRMTGEQLAEPMQVEQLVKVIPTNAQVATFLVLHESTHVGQILTVRKSLGLPRLMG